MCINKVKIAIVMILFIFIINVSMPVQASIIDEIWSTGKEFIDKGKDGGGTFDGKKMQTTVNDLYNLFLMAGIVIAVIIGAFLGIKFMTEGVEGKAKIKEALIPFCVGCLVIFGGFAIWRVAMVLFGEVEEIETSSISQQQHIQSKCDSGKHTFDGYYDKFCNNCSRECDHIMSYDSTNGEMTCDKECGFHTTRCSYGTSSNHNEKCNLENGVCTECGYSSSMDKI